MLAAAATSCILQCREHRLGIGLGKRACYVVQPLTLDARCDMPALIRRTLCWSGGTPSRNTQGPAALLSPKIINFSWVPAQLCALCYCCPVFSSPLRSLSVAIDHPHSLLNLLQLY
jgi:hypothetical protein